MNVNLISRRKYPGFVSIMIESEYGTGQRAVDCRRISEALADSAVCNN